MFLSMESQDMRMCKAESGISGVTVDYDSNSNDNTNHRVYGEDCFGDILNMFDLPMENLDVDDFVEDWEDKLGPIPSEVFRELAPPAPQTGPVKNCGYSMDLPFEYLVLNNKTSQHHLKQEESTFKTYKNANISQQKQPPPFDQHKKLHPSQPSFQAPSPNSVLENRTSTSNNKGISFNIEISIPVRTRTKRSKPTVSTNPWLKTPFIVLLPNKHKKTNKPKLKPLTINTKQSLENSELVGTKKCAHCEITKTPQWREGPMGPKTLCNACGVRYRSGRLYPEYRPAASPTFVPALHSNSHRKVIEMRQKAVK